MGKKSVGRHGAKPPFRESDFAGRPAQEQADLSGALNQLSQQMAASRKLLQEFEGRAALFGNASKSVDDDAPETS